MDRFLATLTRGKALALVGLLFVILVLPLILVYVKKQQEIRSRAAGEAVAFTLIPETDTKNIGESFDIRVVLNSQTNNITGIDIALSYNPTIADLSFAPSAIFNQQLINRVSSESGSLRYAAVDTDITTITGDAIDIGIISLRTKAVGQTTLTFTKSQVVAERVVGALPIGTNSTGSYTVALAPTQTPTPLPTNTPIPTNTPVPTEAPTATPIPPTATPVPVAGDIDGNGTINLLDFNLWRDELLDELEGKATQKKSDLNKDGIIDLLDFNIWRDALIDTLTQ
ncbi:MAG: hypothetical protein HYV39_01225 [Candidatus Levybacteria bacterium]|nr:hypothetical protein [Candidatus Levybacteria bacterium]